MRHRIPALLVLGLTLAVACGVGGGAAVGRQTPSAWAPRGDAGGGPPPAVIASTRAEPTGPRPLPAEARLPLPDDGLSGKVPEKTSPSPPLPPPPPVGLQQVNYSPEAEQPKKPAEPDKGPPPGTAGAILGVEVQGPTAGSPQQPASYTLVVKNHGRDALGQVRVELPVPAGTRVLLSEPQAERPGDRLSWLVGNLDAGGERRLRVDLLPSQAGEIALAPAMSCSALGLRTSVVRPPFALSVTGPDTAAAGDRVVFAIQVGNHTTDPMRLVQLQCQLGAGLWHPQGERIEAELAGGLAAGEVKTIHLQAEARGTGRLQVQVTGASDGRYVGSSQHFVAVNEQSLTLEMNGPRRGMLGHEQRFELEVFNPGKSPARTVKLRQALPQGLEFVSASGQGRYDAKAQVVEWNMGELSGGQRASVTFQAKAKQVGDWAIPATLSAEGSTEVRATHAVRVDVAPALVVEASADDDPIDHGRETTYEVRVYNQGGVPAGDVCVTVQLPETLALASAQGPTKERGKGQVVMFEPVPQLSGRASAVYKLRVRGVRVGAGQVGVEVSANGLASPLRRELSGRVRAAAAERFP